MNHHSLRVHCSPQLVAAVMRQFVVGPSLRHGAVLCTSCPPVKIEDSQMIWQIRWLADLSQKSLLVVDLMF